MKLREEIAREHSRCQCLAIVEWVGDSQKRFNELFKCYQDADKVIAQRAGWPLSVCVEKHPKLIASKFANLLAYLEQDGLHDAVKRNGVRLMQYVSIPGKFEGQVMGLCFAYLENPTESIAVKAFSLTVLGNLAKKYPEINAEIKLVMDAQPTITPALRTRYRQLLERVKSPLKINTSAHGKRL